MATGLVKMMSSPFSRRIAWSSVMSRLKWWFCSVDCPLAVAVAWT
jgi:hypothetical protein